MIIAPVISDAIRGRNSKFPNNFQRLQFKWLGESFSRLPDSLRKSAENKWLKDERKHGHIEANRSLFKITQKISPTGLAMASDDHAICEKAKDYEEKCEHARLISIKLEVKDQFYVLCKILDRAGIEPPEIKAGVTHFGAVNRMCSAKWWRKRLRETHKRWVEAACIQFGSVRRGRSLYVSDDCLASRKSQRNRNDSALKSMIAECVETGEKIQLSDAVEASVSNPANRRNEMMLRMHGMQEWALENEHVCSFLTITCPSKMHAATVRRGQHFAFDNPKYNGTTPRQAAAYLAGVWSRVRAELDRRGITIYGVRVVEPHHDGTPHWHMIVYGKECDVSAAEFIFKDYACAENFGEWTGRKLCLLSTVSDAISECKVRFKPKRLIWVFDEAGNVIKSPVSYVAKYIAKNLEVGGIENKSGDKLGDISSDECKKTKLTEAVERVDAWRSCWGIRQFQFFGTHAVTIWRELRRIKEAPENSELVPLWQSVHKTEEKGASWHAFMTEMDKLPDLIIATEDSENANAYGEFDVCKIIGLVLTNNGLFVASRFKSWVIKQGEADAPWSPSNNCTSSEKRSGGESPDLKKER